VTIKKLSIPLLGQPDPNVPSDVHLVGRYAVGVTWADQHGSIFPFEKLRRDCPCGACAAIETMPATAGWPKDIARANGVLNVTWADGHVSGYPFADLRALCRCAGCTGGH
jgi:prepilin-type processing-associated H-X9-DG protein